jgi:5-hydroxyisourate hydrolase
VSRITTHVLDTSTGRPAEGVPVVLERAGPDGATWEVVGRGTTDADGRQRALAPDGLRLAGGRYRLTFDTGAYFTRTGRRAFFPEVSVVFAIDGGEEHQHVPLLLSPYGYSTYRGS